jgi:hypothetical protein
MCEAVASPVHPEYVGVNQIDTPPLSSEAEVIAYGERAVWATGYSTRVIQVDPGSGERTPLRSGGGGDLAAGPLGVWLATAADRGDHTAAAVARLDPVRHDSDRPIELPGEFEQVLSHVAVSDRHLWVLYGGENLVRVEPESRRIDPPDARGRLLDVRGHGSYVFLRCEFGS